MNQKIRARMVRVIDDEGNQLGVLPLAEGLRRAEEAGLDLVEVAPNTNPPVCKILDFKRYMYERKKKMRQARKHQRQVEVKEIKFRPSIDPHDYQTKLRHICSFLNDDYRVKVTIRYRGRQALHPELAEALVKQLETDVTEVGRVEHIYREGNKIQGLILVKKK